tara:strand:- start:53 stop:754 length:702 start_codon:yes stop_codon:yes gene_type:complete
MSENINIKRLIKDITELNNGNLKSHNIFHSFIDDDIYNIKVLMIGPSDTPYEHGFYFFHIFVPEQYPFVPPVVKYHTQGNNIRFNPNLYTNGKVCLSIINTWSGPQWTSCNSISTVLLSIQSLVFIDSPLHNEPGFEDEKSERVDNYTKIIEHENYSIAIIKMLETQPSGFECFKDIMMDYFINNYDKLINKIDKLKKNDGKLITSNFYNLRIKLNYSNIKKNLETLLDNLNK